MSMASMGMNSMLVGAQPQAIQEKNYDYQYQEPTKTSENDPQSQVPGRQANGEQLEDKYRILDNFVVELLGWQGPFLQGKEIEMEIITNQQEFEKFVLQ